MSNRHIDLAFEDAILLGAFSLLSFSLALYGGSLPLHFLGGCLAGIAGFRAWQWYRWRGQD